MIFPSAHSLLKISPLTAGYALYIIISAAFMRQVLNYFRSILSGAQLSLFIWALFAVALLAVGYLVNKHLLAARKYGNLSLLGVTMALGFAYAISFDVVEERFHLVLFGVLGFLAARDNRQKLGWQSVIAAATLCTLVAGLDECFQFFLPYRVGDPRDVVFGAVGGTWGVFIYLGIYGKIPSPSIGAGVVDSDDSSTSE